MNSFLDGDLASWSYKPILSQENKLLVESRGESCTSTTAFKYWKGIAPSYINDIFMPSLNSDNNRLQMSLDIPLSRISKGQKSMSLLGLKICNKVSRNVKAAATTPFKK